MSKNSWFAARLLFESKHPDEPESEKVFEDRIVLLAADDEDEAEDQAKNLGSKSREEYRNQFGDRVLWEFVEVLDLMPIYADEIGHGSEVYSQFLDEQDLAAVRRSLASGKLGEGSE